MNDVMLLVPTTHVITRLLCICMLLC